jgi:hypothetical protein
VGSLLKGKQSPRMQRLLVVSTRGLLVCSVLAIVVSTAPLVLLLARRENEIIGPTRASLATWYFMTFGMALQLLLLCVFALYIKRKIKRAFDMSYQMNKSERILAMRAALLGVQNSAVAQSGVQCVIYFALGLFPFFYTKHDYWFPVGSLAYPLIGYKLANTVIKTVANSSNATSGKSKESNESSLAHPSQSDDKSFKFDSVHPPSSFAQGGSVALANAPHHGGGHGNHRASHEHFEKMASQYQEPGSFKDEDEHSGDEYV